MREITQRSEFNSLAHYEQIVHSLNKMFLDSTYLTSERNKLCDLFVM
jgi:hypothetical protein